MRILAVTNQKGGVGKTTSVANLGAAIAAGGHDVCLIDLDPQSHLTLHLGLEPGASPASTYDVMTGEASLAATAVKVRERLWVAPSTIDLAAAEIELVTTVGREQILRDKLAAAGDIYEYVMIDCPPSLGLLTLNALAAAQDVLIPLQPHFLALQGLGKLLETVSLVQRRINPGLRVSGVLLCMYESATRLSGEVVADVRQFLDSSRGQGAPWSQARLFENVIRRNIKLAECPSHGQSIFDYEPGSNGAADYRCMAEEFLEVFPPAGKKDAQTRGCGDAEKETERKDERPTSNAQRSTSNGEEERRGDPETEAKNKGTQGEDAVMAAGTGQASDAAIGDAGPKDECPMTKDE